MLVGVPKEIKDNEYRVAMTPAGVQQLIEQGHQVLVETMAGDGSRFPDEQYARVGAKIVPTPADAWGAEMVVKVKEPIAVEYPLLRSDLVLFTYLHLAAEEKLTRAMIDSGVTGIPVGRTNMGELGMRMCTDNPLRGRTHNPWQRSLTVGGSSGGDAAAVAVGMTPLGLGSDLGGSLRVPAACCGVAALKATSGRVASAASLEPRDQGFAGQVMTVEGP